MEHREQRNIGLPKGGQNRSAFCEIASNICARRAATGVVLRAATGVVLRAACKCDLRHFEEMTDAREDTGLSDPTAVLTNWEHCSYSVDAPQGLAEATIHRRACELATLFL